MSRDRSDNLPRQNKPKKNKKRRPVEIKETVNENLTAQQVLDRSKLETAALKAKLAAEPPVTQVTQAEAAASLVSKEAIKRELTLETSEALSNYEQMYRNQEKKAVTLTSQIRGVSLSELSHYSSDEQLINTYRQTLLEHEARLAEIDQSFTEARDNAVKALTAPVEVPDTKDSLFETMRSTARGFFTTSPQEVTSGTVPIKILDKQVKQAMTEMGEQIDQLKTLNEEIAAKVSEAQEVQEASISFSREYMPLKEDCVNKMKEIQNNLALLRQLSTTPEDLEVLGSLVQTFEENEAKFNQITQAVENQSPQDFTTENLATTFKRIKDLAHIQSELDAFDLSDQVAKAKTKQSEVLKKTAQNQQIEQMKQGISAVQVTLANYTDVGNPDYSTSTDVKRKMAEIYPTLDAEDASLTEDYAKFSERKDLGSEEMIKELDVFIDRFAKKSALMGGAVSDLLATEVAEKKEAIKLAAEEIARAKAAEEAEKARKAQLLAEAEAKLQAAQEALDAEARQKEENTKSDKESVVSFPTEKPPIEKSQKTWRDLHADKVTDYIEEPVEPLKPLVGPDNAIDPDNAIEKAREQVKIKKESIAAIKAQAKIEAEHMELEQNKLLDNPHLTPQPVEKESPENSFYKGETSEFAKEIQPNHYNLTGIAGDGTKIVVSEKPVKAMRAKVYPPNTDIEQALKDLAPVDINQDLKDVAPARVKIDPPTSSDEKYTNAEIILGFVTLGISVIFKELKKEAQKEAIIRENRDLTLAEEAAIGLFSVLSVVVTAGIAGVIATGAAIDKTFDPVTKAKTKLFGFFSGNEDEVKSEKNEADQKKMDSSSGP